MEKHQRSFRPGRKEVQLSGSNNAGGSGMEGVVVLGGALALASLVAAFTIKKGNRQEDNMETTNLAAVDCCRQEEDGTEGLGFILQEDSSSILHLNSCSTNHGTSKIHITPIETSELVSTQSLITPEENTMQCEREDSVSGHQEIPIHDKEQESIVKTVGYGDFEEISVPVTDHKPMNVVKNDSDDSFVVETIEIEIEDGEAVDADAEQSTIEEKSALQTSLPSTEEEKSSVSFSRGEEEEENSLMQSSILTEEEENYSPMAFSVPNEEEEEEEDEYSPSQSSVSTSEEDEEECNSLMQSSVATEEEYYPRRSSFSTEEEDEEYSPTQSLSSTEEEEEEHSPMEEGEHSPMEEEEGEEAEKDSPLQSSYSTGEEYGEEEEYSLRQSSFSTEESEEDSPGEPLFSTDEEEEEEEEEEDEKDANVTETEEESSQGTWSSSTDSNVRPIWPAEMMRVLSPESKQMNISHRVSVKKFVGKDTTTNNGKNKERTQELVPMNGQKEHSANRQIWVWLGIVLPLLFLLANGFLKPSDLSNSVAFVPMK